MDGPASGEKRAKGMKDFWALCRVKAMKREIDPLEPMLLVLKRCLE